MALMPGVYGPDPYARPRRQSTNPLSSIISQLTQQAAAARAENLRRYEEAMEIYKQIEQMYAPGGSFLKGAEAQIERGKEREVARGMQALVSAGLAGTTRAAGLGRLYEEEVATPARMKLETIRTQALAQAMQARAGFIERRQDTYPDLGMIAQLASRIPQTTAYTPQTTAYTPYVSSTPTRWHFTTRRTSFMAPGEFDRW